MMSRNKHDKVKWNLIRFEKWKPAWLRPFNNNVAINKRDFNLI